MKQKLKKLKSLFAITLTGLLLFSCQEEFTNKPLNENGLIVQKISLKEVNSPYLNQKILLTANDIKSRNLKSKNNALDKMVYDSINNFYFDDENGIYINDGIKNSYTFEMVRPDGNGKLENLVFASKPDGTYSIYFVKYDFTETELVGLSPEEIENSSKEFYEVNLNNSESTLTSKCSAVVLCYTSPRDDGAVDGPNQICTYELNGCGGDISSGGAGTSGTATGGTSPGTSGGVITGPVRGSGSVLEVLPNPCDKLKKLFDPTKGNIKPTILNNLRPNIAINPSGEAGATLAMSPTGASTNTTIPATTANSVGIPTGSNSYSGIHTHPLDTYPMFSWSDVYTLYQMNNNLASYNEGMASYLLVCQDDNGVFQTYAIVIDEIAINNIENVLNSPENNGCTHDEVALNMNANFEKKYAKADALDNNYERAFLQQMFGYNVSL
ncbi:hypothetical protein, partial [Flavobacterium sp.]|uniref:hypothetical protein n=1 Tax=Flavobacterium sp. TaxID=239 RepID=UPI00374CEC92